MISSHISTNSERTPTYQECNPVPKLAGGLGVRRFQRVRELMDILLQGPTGDDLKETLVPAMSKPPAQVRTATLILQRPLVMAVEYLELTFLLQPPLTTMIFVRPQAV